MRKMVKNYDTDNERSQMAVWNGGIEAAKAENWGKNRRNFWIHGQEKNVKS